jgi:hypothetical protein
MNFDPSESVFGQNRIEHILHPSSFILYSSGMNHDDLAQTPDLLEEYASGLSPQRLTEKPDGAEFSFTGQACHLRDLEIEGYGVRVRRILAEENPDLPDFDGAKVAAERNYDAQDFREALESFRAARVENLRVVETLTPDQLARTGVYDGSRKVTLLDVLGMMREHDTDHIAQWRTLREALG